MDIRNAYDEFLAIVAVSAMFVALGYALLTGYGIGHYFGKRAEASGYPGVQVISESIASRDVPQQSLNANVRIIHDRLRDWRTVTAVEGAANFNGYSDHLSL